MAGARRRLEREQDDRVHLAHLTAMLSRAAKLSNDFRKYLPKRGDKKPQSPAEMLSVLRELQARGAPMTIKKLEN